jgi:hypothetical protein
MYGILTARDGSTKLLGLDLFDVIVKSRALLSEEDAVNKLFVTLINSRGMHKLVGYSAERLITT